MRFEEALAAMREGKRVKIGRRTYKLENKTIWYEEGDDDAILGISDLLDERWEILEGPKKFWVNVYKTGRRTWVALYTRKNDAVENAGVDYIKTIEIEV